MRMFAIFAYRTSIYMFEYILIYIFICLKIIYIYISESIWIQLYLDYIFTMLDHPLWPLCGVTW